MKLSPSFRIVDFLKLTRKIGTLDAALFYGQHLAGMSPTYGGIRLRKGTSDLDVFKQVFVWEEYAYPVKGEILTIVDAGANIGCASVWFAQRYPRATVYALEPEPSNFEALRRNTLAFPRIQCLPYGLWSKSCKLRIETPEAENWAFRVIETTDEDPHGIAAMSVDDLFREHELSRIDILKIDVETSEKHIFGEASKDWLPKIRYLLIETHDFMEKGCAKAVTSAVFEFDFDMFTLGENLVFVNNAPPTEVLAPLESTKAPTRTTAPIEVARR